MTTQPTEYTVDYFIKKFEAIPYNLWCTDEFTKEIGMIKHCCAMGFCGETNDDRPYEAIYLDKIIHEYFPMGIYYINDRGFIISGNDIKVAERLSVAKDIAKDILNSFIKEELPKYRVIKALKIIKAKKENRLSSQVLQEILEN